MLQLKFTTDFFSSDCLTFSLSKPKKKKKNKRYCDTEKGKDYIKETEETLNFYSYIFPVSFIPIVTERQS